MWIDAMTASETPPPANDGVVIARREGETVVVLVNWLLIGCWLGVAAVVLKVLFLLSGADPGIRPSEWPGWGATFVIGVLTLPLSRLKRRLLARMKSTTRRPTR